MNNFIQAIENATNRIRDFLNQLLSGILSILEKIYQSISSVIYRIKSYFVSLFIVLRNLFSAFVRLILLYIPGILLLLYGLVAESVWSTIAGIIWVVGLTLVGFFYEGNTP
jgi:phage-related protein